MQLNILKTKFPKIKKIPGVGTKAVYIKNGELITNLKSKPLNSTKSLDFFDDGTNTYYVCKYTKGTGGSQDNQYEDVVLSAQGVRTIKEANLCEQNFVFLLDGDHYTDTKLKNLKKLISPEKNKNILVKTSRDI